MEYQKILHLLNEANYSKFVTRKWNIVNDNSKVNYYVGNEIIHNIEVLKCNLCDLKNACILESGEITVLVVPEMQVTFKNYTPFTKCTTKIIDEMMLKI